MHHRGGVRYRERDRREGVVASPVLHTAKQRGGVVGHVYHVAHCTANDGAVLDSRCEIDGQVRRGARDQCHARERHIHRCITCVVLGNDRVDARRQRIICRQGNGAGLQEEILVERVGEAY